MRSARLEGGNAENRLAIFFAKDDRRSNNVAHELHARHTDLQREFGAIRQFAGALRARLDSDREQSASWDIAVCRTRVDKKQSFPSTFRIGRIHNRDGDKCCAHPTTIA